MRELIEAGRNNVEQNVESIRKTAKAGAYFLGAVGLSGSFFQVTIGSNSTTLNSAIGAIAGVFGLLASTTIPSTQNNLADWGKRIAFTATTSLTAVGTNMAIENILNATKNSADAFESPYVAAAIGGAIAYLAAASLLSKTQSGEERPTLTMAEHAASTLTAATLSAAIPGIMKILSMLKITDMKESVITKVGEEYLFQAPLSTSTCLAAGLLLGAAAASAYYFQQGYSSMQEVVAHREAELRDHEAQRMLEEEAMREAEQRFLATLPLLQRDREERQRLNLFMAVAIEPLVRTELGANRGTLEPLPLDLLRLAVEYAVPHIGPRTDIDISKLDPAVNASIAVKNIQSMREQAALANPPPSSLLLSADAVSKMEKAEESRSRSSSTDSATGYAAVQMERGYASRNRTCHTQSTTISRTM